MEKAYKFLEELQDKVQKTLEYKITEYEVEPSWSIDIYNLYIIDKQIIDIIHKYTEDYYIDINYKKIGLILSITIWKN